MSFLLTRHLPPSCIIEFWTLKDSYPFFLYVYCDIYIYILVSNVYFLFMINPPKAGNIGDGEARSIQKLSLWRAENYVKFDAINLLGHHITGLGTLRHTSLAISTLHLFRQRPTLGQMSIGKEKLHFVHAKNFDSTSSSSTRTGQDGYHAVLSFCKTLTKQVYTFRHTSWTAHACLS